MCFAYNASTGNYIVASISYVASVSLDELDGNTARYLGQTSLFGMILDILIDEASVLCLCTVLSTIYPQYIIIFQLYTLLDFTGQWTNYQYAAMYRNNNFTRADDWLLNMYFNKPMLTNLWVYGNHVFLLMIYLCHHTSEPEVPLFGSSICIWKVLAFLSAPWSVSRLCIMVYLLITSMTDIAHQDNLLRVKQRQESGKRWKIENGLDSSGKLEHGAKNNVEIDNAETFGNLKHSVEVEDSEEILQTIVNRINSAHADSIISNENEAVCRICRNVLFCQLLNTRNRCCLGNNKSGSVRQRNYRHESLHCCNIHQHEKRIQEKCY
ncbi:CDP-diacylglycerol--inositol 3-phosphatidyltransferase-like isoform X2 [Mercenaria mercenaria]|nr:CDP-diacylglycerol--inositol 3-phosphatidyltransferase-like isoform X2 [Mercenaria mercenaria]XP_045198494.2 CDP-diacylglycerol--inositol 3-phosphatidyltransferase-like isoform X2 [Mercenaria mercenaria]XP_045198502.2 CDP-diacylglycerol--inositol 3-phosphatidyltransferase-like isoform X2 [Mercenaria mercenaria]